MEWFVDEGSIVRRIWGSADTILLIFGGASAEFALNKAVDWLYFTGKLPADPIGRLFSTVTYARNIVFSSMEDANATIDKIRMIHTSVEKNRGSTIPDWAYRDVLFMLIHYSIASFELMHRKLSDNEKEEVYNVFYRLAIRMQVQSVPLNYKDWLPVYHQHLENDLAKSNFTVDLFRQYRKHLGDFRYFILKESQILVVPERVRHLLGFRNASLAGPLVSMYKLSAALKADRFVMSLLLPDKYRRQILDLNRKR
jgi:mpaB/rubber oxygenase-like protein